MSGVDMRLGPGAARELHRHKEAEWGCVLEACARLTAAAVVGLQIREGRGDRPSPRDLVWTLIGQGDRAATASGCVWRQRSKRYDRCQSKCGPFHESKFVKNCHLASPV